MKLFHFLAYHYHRTVYESLPLEPQADELRARHMKKMIYHDKRV